MAIDPIKGIEIGTKILGGLGGIFGKKKKRKSPEQIRWEQNQSAQEKKKASLLDEVMNFDSVKNNEEFLANAESTAVRALDQANRLTSVNFGRQGSAERDTNFGRVLAQKQNRILDPVKMQVVQMNAQARQNDLMRKIQALGTLGPGTVPMFPESEPIDMAPYFDLLGQGVDDLQGILSKKPSKKSTPSKTKKGKPRRNPGL